MVKGLVYKNRPVIKLNVSNGLKTKKVITLVDTGFTGELKLSVKEAMDLNIVPDRLEIVRLANGNPAKMFASSAEVSMEGINNSVEVLISDGIATIGISLLRKFGYDLNIDLKKDILLLQK